MFVKRIIAVCITTLLIAGGTLYTFERFGQAAYSVALRAGDIEMKKVEIEQMKALSEVAKSLPPRPPVPAPSPSVEIPGGGKVLKLNHVHSTPTPAARQMGYLSRGDGKQVLDGKTVLEEAPEIEIEIELPKHPPLDFIPHVPITSP